MTSSTTLLSGWGRTAATRASVLRPAEVEEVADALSTAGPRGVLARGLGRAYGDAAQNAGGTVIDMTALDAVEALDAERGVVVAQAGLSVGALSRALLPHGLFAPVVPGTQYVTLGGGFASDVHGKNHHADGGFCRHVDWIDLITPDGELRRAGADGPDPELFWATAGGMGLTGIVVRMQLRLLRVPGDRLHVTTERVRDLDALLARLDERDGSSRYSVAWVDCLAGRSPGRAVAQWADHAAARLGAPPAPVRDGARVGVPSPAPPLLASRRFARVFNGAWYRRSPARAEHAQERLDAFLHPLDGVRNWNRLYGRRGFVQYQCVVPYGEEEALRRLVEGAGRAGAFLSVLKRLGAASPGPLSFPAPGWTLAVDLPAGRPGLAADLDAFDERVAAAGGRVYLAKDARVRPATLVAMYPRLDELRAVRDRVDPDRVLRSDLARRLEL